MVGQDFGHIEAGRVQPYGSLGFPHPAQHFGDPSETLDSSRLYYARKPSVLTASEELRKRFLEPPEPLAAPETPRRQCAVQ